MEHLSDRLRPSLQHLQYGENSLWPSHYYKTDLTTLQTCMLLFDESIGAVFGLYDNRLVPLEQITGRCDG